MAVNNLTVSTFSDLVAKYPNARQKIWAAKAIQTTSRVNIFAKMEGAEGSGKPVVRKDDLKKTRGDKIVFTVAAPLGSRATLGAETLRGNEETLKLGTFELQIDLRRHAAGLDDKHRMLTAVELDYIIAEQLGAHQGLTQQDDLMMMFRRRAIVSNSLFGGNKANVEALKTADVVNKTIVETAGEILKSRGGEPAMVQTYGEQDVQRFFYVSSHTALNNLRGSLSSEYQGAAPREGKNPLFTGEHLDWNGHIIIPHLTVDHDGYGPVGSPLLPKAFLGNAIAAGTTAIDITGGRSATGAALTRPQYFGFFSNFDFLFTEDQTAAPDTTDRYVIVYNLSGANAGKWGFYRYVTNDGNKLTTKNEAGSASTGAGGRLAAAVSGNASSKIGNVTWDANINTDAHPAGSLVIEANSRGVAIGYSLVLGKNAAFRGYGNPPFKRISDDEDYEFKKAEGYQVCYGQSPLYDTNNEPRNYSLVTHAVTYPGIVLPTVS
jgi:hypothetical protein